MTKAGAIAILTTIFLGLTAWAGREILDSKVKVAKLETDSQNTIILLREVRDDVKKLLRRP